MRRLTLLSDKHKHPAHPRRKEPVMEMTETYEHAITEAISELEFAAYLVKKYQTSEAGNVTACRPLMNHVDGMVADILIALADFDR